MLPDIENGVILRSLVLSQYQRVTDEQTDRQDTRPIAKSCSSVAERNKNIFLNSQDQVLLAVWLVVDDTKTTSVFDRVRIFSQILSPELSLKLSKLRSPKFTH